MTYDMYLSNADGFLSHAFAALGHRFKDRAQLDAFYSSLASDAVRREFLRTASFYRFLVKHGDWISYHTENPSVVNYLTETYKIVALFALIESVSGESHQDFFDWLIGKGSFPITDKKELDSLHREYKATFGSIRRCVWFFERLSEQKQKSLRAAVRIHQKPIGSIQELAKALYQLRSSFVHEARLVLELSDGILISKLGKKIAAFEVTLSDLMDAFEECIIEVFRQRT